MTIKDAVDRIKSDLSLIGNPCKRVQVAYRDGRCYLFFNLDRLPINSVLFEKKHFERVVLTGGFDDWWSEIFEYIKGEYNFW